jgi:hypothetical protein
MRKALHGSVSPTLKESALLSGGEGQRVRLGRALQRKQARLVILDDFDWLYCQMTGFMRTQILAVAASLRLAEHLQEGGRTAEDFAAASAIEPFMAFRFLRACTKIGLTACDDGRTFRSTSRLPSFTRRCQPDFRASPAWVHSFCRSRPKSCRTLSGGSRRLTTYACPTN